MRFFPRNLCTSVQIFRCPTTGDRKYPSTPTYTVEGAFQPQVRRSHSLEGGMYVVEYEVYVDGNTDLQRGDKLVIKGETYYVRSILTSMVSVFPFTLAYISKEA